MITGHFIYLKMILHSFKGYIYLKPLMSPYLLKIYHNTIISCVSLSLNFENVCGFKSLLSCGREDKWNHLYVQDC